MCRRAGAAGGVPLLLRVLLVALVLVSVLSPSHSAGLPRRIIGGGGGANQRINSLVQRVSRKRFGGGGGGGAGGGNLLGARPVRGGPQRGFSRGGSLAAAIKLVSGSKGQSGAMGGNREYRPEEVDKSCWDPKHYGRCAPLLFFVHIYKTAVRTVLSLAVLAPKARTHARSHTRTHARAHTHTARL